MAKLQSIQIFRGLAALWVLVYHVYLQFFFQAPETGVTEIPLFAHMGYLGVDFFFVLSGFIIVLIHEDDLGRPEQAYSFAIKRFIRIWPLVFVIVLVKSAYLLAIRPSDLEVELVVNNLLLIPGPKIIGVAWTLGYEAVFYAAFLLAIILGRKFAMLGAAFWVLLVFGLSPFEGQLSEPLKSFSRSYVLQFLAGGATAIYWRKLNLSGKKISAYLFLPLLMLVVLGSLIHPLNATHREWQHVHDPLLGRIYWAVLFSALILVAVSNERLFRSRSLVPLLALGNASFSIYLFHNEFITLMIIFLKRIPGYMDVHGTVWIVLIGSAALAVGYVVHVAVEKPLLRISRRLFLPEKGKASGLPVKTSVL